MRKWELAALFDKEGGLLSGETLYEMCLGESDYFEIYEGQYLQ